VHVQETTTPLPPGEDGEHRPMGLGRSNMRKELRKENLTKKVKEEIKMEKYFVRKKTIKV
jgi:hypothetical protein